MHGGFPPDVYASLRNDPALLREAAHIVLAESFPESVHDDIAAAVGLDLESGMAGCSRRDTTLAGEGAHGYFFFVIEGGTADVLHDGRIVRQLGPGDFFGEIAILEPGRRRTATAIASSDMRVLVFFGTNYHALVAAAPQIGERVRAVVQERLGATP